MPGHHTHALLRLRQSRLVNRACPAVVAPCAQGCSIWWGQGGHTRTCGVSREACVVATSNRAHSAERRAADAAALRRAMAAVQSGKPPAPSQNATYELERVLLSNGRAADPARGAQEVQSAEGKTAAGMAGGPWRAKLT